MLQTIDISELLPGMFVVKVTKQQGELQVTACGKVKNNDYITSMVEKGVLEVEIDINKSTHEEGNNGGNINDEDYTNTAGLTYNQQLEASLKLHDQAKSIQGRLIKQAAKGKLSNLDEVNDITQQLVSTAFDCDDALRLVTLLKGDVEYFLEHSINCALLLVIFGQALGLEKSVLHKLGTGALLMDIGMMKLPLLLTEKNAPLSPEEAEKMHTHIDLAAKLITPLEEIDEISTLVMTQHHERLDGTGYPNGLRDEQISLYGRMAAIVDSYDSMITARPYRKAITPAKALKKLMKEEVGLDKELLNQFISCIGVYPVGSLVKLNSGNIAMIVSINKQQPLAPIVMVFYNVETQKDVVKRIDLSLTDDEITSSMSLDEIKMGMPQLLSKNLSNS